MRALWAALLCLVASLAGADDTAAPDAHYRLTLELDPTAGRLAGTARIEVRETGDYVLRLDRRFTLSQTPTELGPARDEAREQHWRLRLAAGDSLELTWHGTPEQLPGAAGIAPEGSYLPGGLAWYPRLERVGDTHPLLHAWTVELALPAGQRGLASGAMRAAHDDGTGWRAEFDFPHPGRGIDLFAGPFELSERQVTSRDGRRLALRTWFHPGLDELSDAYLGAAADFIRRHEHDIGAYPFDGFDIVSSPQPVGLGMPGATLLGIEVLRLPFIRTTSLGHEVVHNWWGNGVYPDYARGNWSEGLTTWMADHAYALERDADEARSMRENWMRELSALPPDARLPIRAFTSPHHDVARVASYGKTALFFALLEDTLGEDVFNEAVRALWQARRFRITGWDAIRTHFEDAAGRPLDALFEAWLTRPGLPEVSLLSARWDDGELTVELEQAGRPWPLDVPLGIESAAGLHVEHVRLDRNRARHTLALAEAPERVVLDPGRRLPRRIAPEDAPPLLRELRLAGPARLRVLDPALAEAASGVARALAGREAKVVDEDAQTDDATPLIIVGSASAVSAWRTQHGLSHHAGIPHAGGEVRIWTQRAGSTALVFVVSDDAGALAASARALPHHGNRSWLVFEHGRVVARGTWPLAETAIEVERAAR